MQSITLENIGEILQKIYDSEIDIQFGWNWDGGLDYIITNNPYPLVENDPKEIQHTCEADFLKAFKILIEDVVLKFPNSTFSKWWEKMNA